MIRRLHILQIALLYCVNSSAQTLWSEQSTHFDLHFEPIALIAVSEARNPIVPRSKHNRRITGLHRQYSHYISSSLYH